MVDVDGTILEKVQSTEYEKAKPLPGAVETINSWYQQGDYIILWTARHPSIRAMTEQQLNRYGLQYHELRMDKPYCYDIHIYDDRSIEAYLVDQKVGIVEFQDHGDPVKAQVDRFVADTKAEMESKGIKVTLENTKYVWCHEGDYTPESKITGFFDDEEDNEFRVAVGKPIKDWLPTYVHEYAHFLQWQEGFPGYNDYPMDELEDWTRGSIYITPGRAWEITRAIQRVELDAERKVGDLVKEYGLPVDMEQYNKSANAYLLMYNVIALFGSWPVHIPYERAELCDIMPPTLDIDYNTGHIPYVKEYLKHCFNIKEKETTSPRPQQSPLP
jgi:hypothetical protein